MTATKSKKRRRALVGAGALVLAAAGVFTLALGGDRSPEQTSESSAGPEHATSGVGAARQWLGRFRVGDRSKYRLEFETELRSTGAQPVLALTLNGQLTVTVVEVRGNEVLLANAISEPRLSTKNASERTRSQLANVGPEFERTQFFTVSEHGAVHKAMIPPEASSIVQSIGKSIAASMQFVRPADALGPSWQAQELDTTGKYLASYEQKNRGVFEKKKLRYLSLLGVTGAGRAESKTDVLESLAGFTFGAEEQLSSLDLVERVQGTSGGFVNLLEAATRLKLTLVETGRDSIAVRALQARASELSALAIYETPEKSMPSPEVDLARIAGRSFSDMAAELLSLPGEKHREARERLFSGLAALFRRSDAAVDEALAYIDKDSKNSRFIMDALANAGTPKAQAALASLLDREGFASRTKKSALIGLSMVKRPTEETVEKLSSLFGDPELGRQATYGYGTAIHNLLERDRPRADRHLNVLLGRLNTTGSQTEQVQLLSALGNAGHPGALGAIEKRLGSEQTSVRAAAARALRLLPDVDPALLELSRDKESAVRQEAIQAIADRPASDAAVNALSVIARGDGDYRTRLLAVRTLARWAPEQPKARAVLEWVAKHDRVDRLRQFAAQALS